MAQTFFKGFDFSNFWRNSEYALKNYVEEYPSPDLISSVEQDLGYKLPASYVDFMKLHNGGIPEKCCFTKTDSDGSGDDYTIFGFLGIGRSKDCSLCGEHGSMFMMEEWGYPNTGVYICDCPSAGHDMVMLDYSECGNSGEPRVVLVEQEFSYRKTLLAENFELFVLGLHEEEEY